MNILLISNIYPEPESYGIGRDTNIVHYFAKSWVKQGHNVVVFHLNYNAVSNIKHFFSFKSHIIKQTLLDGVLVVCGESQLFKPHSLSPISLRQKILAKRMIMFLSQKYPCFKPDVISVHFPMIVNPFVEYLPWNCPKMGVFHGTDVRLLQAMDDNIRKKFILELGDNYNRFAFRSPKLLETAISLGFNREKSVTIITGISENLIANEKIIENKIYEKEENIQLIFAGKLVKQKRIEVVLEALSLLQGKLKFRFTIVGDGPEFENLNKISTKFNIQKFITFSGEKNRKEVSSLMSSSNIFIMMSTNETLGLVYLEAMAQGCIVIGSKGEGIDGIIRNEFNGYLVDPFDVQAISEAIYNISKLDITKKIHIINNAYRTVRDNTEEKMSAYYLSQLKGI